MLIEWTSYQDMIEGLNNVNPSTIDYNEKIIVMPLWGYNLKVMNLNNLIEYMKPLCFIEINIPYDLICKLVKTTPYTEEKIKYFITLNDTKNNNK